MNTLIHDLRAAIRQWLRAPGLAAVAIVVMGLAAGGTLALFSLLDVLMFRELPVRQPQQLVGISAVDPSQPTNTYPVPLSALQRLVDGQDVLSALAGVGGAGITEGSAAERHAIMIDAVTGQYFDVLGVRAEAGRLITPEDVAASATVAVISHDYWQRRLGANLHVIGQTIALRHVQFTVIGVTPRGFSGLEIGATTDVTIPLGTLQQVDPSPPNYPPLAQIVGRLADGVTLPRARSQIQTFHPVAIDDALPSVFTAEEREAFRTSTFEVTSAATGISSGYRRTYARPLTLLFLGSGLVLVLACANLSTLLLARSAAREQELGVRAAVGASAMQLVRQVLIESVLLSVAGTALSVPIALWTARSLSLTMWQQPDFPPFDFTPDLRVVLAILGCAIGAGLLFGLLPAYRATRPDLLLSLRVTGAASARTRRWGRRLLVAQVAIAVVLFVVAWLVTANLRQLAVPPFPVEGVSIAALDPQTDSSSHLDVMASCRQLVDELSRIGGMDAVSLSEYFPLTASLSLEDDDWRLVGAADAPESSGVRATFVPVSPGFFRTLGLGVTRGRDFAWTDDAGHPPVVILSAGLARQIFGDQSPVGRRVRTGAGAIGNGARRPDVEVIGATVDTRVMNLHDRQARVVFTSLMQEPPRYLDSPFVLFRAHAPLPPIWTEVRRRIEARGQSHVEWERTATDQIDQSLLRERLTAIGGTYFGGLAALMLVVGLAGVLSYNVSKRTREIGLRSALGATPGSLHFMIVRDAIVTASIGLLLGLPGAWMVTRLLRSTLTQVSAYDPLAFVSASAITILVSVIAAWLPARRAAAITPMEALRIE